MAVEPAVTVLTCSCVVQPMLWAGSGSPVGVVTLIWLSVSRLYPTEARVLPAFAAVSELGWSALSSAHGSWSNLRYSAFER